MVYDVKIGELLAIDCSGYIFATWKENDIRTLQYLEEGSIVLVVGKKIIQKFVNITSGSSTGWVHIASLRRI